MRCSIDTWSISQLNIRWPKIDPKPQYQRGEVWNHGKKQLLIDSILRGYDMPKFYLRDRPDGEKFKWEVVDGQQRLRTIEEYFEGGFSLVEDCDEFEEFGDLGGRHYAELPDDAKDMFLACGLSIVRLDDATDTEIRDLFLRLQEGVPLNAAEKRHAMAGNVRDFISELSGEGGNPHRVLTELQRIKNKRFEWEDLIAHVVRLEIAGMPADVKAVDLKKLYIDEAGFDKDGAKAKKIKRVLGFMAKVFAAEPPEFDIKWGFVDMYLLISTMIDEYAITSRNDDFLRMYLGFEQERRAVEDTSDLVSAGSDEWDRDLFTYIEAFVRDGGKRASIDSRHAVYLRRALRDMPDLVPKDSTRAFTTDERVVIWRRDQELCVICKKSIKFADMHADHVHPHAKGGLTSIANGQSLCAACNQSKGART